MDLGQSEAVQNKALTQSILSHSTRIFIHYLFENVFPFHLSLLLLTLYHFRFLFTARHKTIDAINYRAF